MALALASHARQAARRYRLSRPAAVDLSRRQRASNCTPSFQRLLNRGAGTESNPRGASELKGLCDQAASLLLGDEHRDRASQPLARRFDASWPSEGEIVQSPGEPVYVIEQQASD